MGDNSTQGTGDLGINTQILIGPLGCAAAVGEVLPGCEAAEWSHWAELGLCLQGLTHAKACSALC